jgi:hypothetical protein
VKVRLSEHCSSLVPLSYGSSADRRTTTKGLEVPVDPHRSPLMRAISAAQGDLQSEEEGLEPLKAWVTDLINEVIGKA